ncbi:MAG: S-methyl-5-thioribose-1-phosphate isomerase [Bradymonadaceae bacterium]|nr:S-methyl-5-thioribose-1-phosphate isomerase [Lujinxingiaceae bacterium]
MDTQLERRVVPIRWIGNVIHGHLEMLDQRLLPVSEVWHRMATAEDVAAGIRDMVIRGAPAIGIAAAYGLALGMREYVGRDQGEQVASEFERLALMLAKTRPTAVNLFWAIERCQMLAASFEGSSRELVVALFAEADAILHEDCENNLRMGRFGAELFNPGARILTHCNTGGLATGGYGTALGIIRACHAAGKLAHVWVDETRPYLQGARLTAWECLQEGLPATLITDNMAAHFMKLGQVDAVIVGTDRVVANGDVANKIGTYGLAVLCKHHAIPFYVAAPISTIDLATAHGDDIVIEQRPAQEVTHIGDRRLAPEGIGVAHPAFDVTPADLVTAIITELGVARAPYAKSLVELIESA